MNAPRVGVLALQGASEPHRRAFGRLGVEAPEVRDAESIAELSHLVLPGGESTTLHKLMQRFGLWAPIIERWRKGELVLFGTCAGAILLARSDSGTRSGAGLLDAGVERNAYGRQIDSFERPVRLLAGARDSAPWFPGLFIRAPRLIDVGPGVHVLAHDGQQPVALEDNGLLVTTFHPELTDDPWFHARFLGVMPTSLGSAPPPPRSIRRGAG